MCVCGVCVVCMCVTCVYIGPQTNVLFFVSFFVIVDVVIIIIIYCYCYYYYYMHLHGTTSVITERPADQIVAVPPPRVDRERHHDDHRGSGSCRGGGSTAAAAAAARGSRGRGRDGTDGFHDRDTRGLTTARADGPVAAAREFRRTSKQKGSPPLLRRARVEAARACRAVREELGDPTGVISDAAARGGLFQDLALTNLFIQKLSIAR